MEIQSTSTEEDVVTKKEIPIEDTMFVRSQDQLAIDSPKATGLRMTYAELVEIFGSEKLKSILSEIWDRGSAIIVKDESEPSASIRRVRIRHRLSHYGLACKARLGIWEVINAEDKSKRTSMEVLSKICAALQIDVRRISIESFE